MKNFYRIGLFLTLVIICIRPLQAQWTKCTEVPGDNRVGSGAQLIYLAVNGTRLFVPRPYGLDSIFYSDNSGGTWTVSRVPPWVLSGTSYYPTVTGVWVNSGVIFASGSVSQGNVFWRSSDNGANWTASSTGILTGGIDPTPKVFFASGNTAYVGTGHSGIFLSTDNGATWSTARGGIPTYTFAGFTSYVSIDCFATIGNDIFAGLDADFTTGYGLRHTTFGGTSWDSLGRGLPAKTSISSMIAVGTTLYARMSGYGQGVYKSTDLGSNWTDVTNGLPGRNNLGAGAQGLFAVGNNIFADTFLGDYVSTDGGGSWAPMNNSGLPATYYINGYAVVGNTMYITAVDVTTFPTTTAVWKRGISEVTAVNTVSGGLPASFIFEQNYPNPFNPGTIIRYQLPASGHVMLSVYNLLGQEVARLVDGVQTAGYKEVSFNASNLSSGVYFYRIQAGTYSDMKKMIIMK
jgi:hypothetical protein